MELKLLTPKIVGFEKKIRQYNHEVFKLLQKVTVPVAVGLRIGTSKMIISLNRNPQNYPPGLLELWYYTDKGYYWYRHIVSGTEKKYSAKELLTTEFITQDLKNELDELFNAVLAVFDKELEELSTAIRKDKYDLLNYTEFYVNINEDRANYTAFVNLPTLGNGNMNSWDKFISIRYQNEKFERIFRRDGPHRTTLEDIFPLG